MTGRRSERDGQYTTRLTRTVGQRLNLERPGVTSPAAWFLGPKGENEEAMVRMVSDAVRSHAEARRRYKPDDPPFASQEELDSDLHEKSLELLQSRMEELLQCLSASLPLSSYRNQSHMYWDITLPGAVGYFAAMLYNQNNVAAEASPVTTALEILVGEDLCRMLGFGVGDTDDGIRPWGHITCDGSVANGEAMWAARNLKFLPVALAAAIRQEPELQAARSATVMTIRGGRSRLVDLETWDLLNLPVDEVIGLVARIGDTTDVEPDALRWAVDDYSVQNVGLAEFERQHLDHAGHARPVVCVPATAHYSWPKTAALLGLGTRTVRFVGIDLDGRMDTVALRRELDDCLETRCPVIQVVAVVGSTEEGAVDPLADIVAIRDEYRQLGLEFAIHVDGAWGGYFAAMTRPTPPQREFRAPDPMEGRPDRQMSAYVARQYDAFPKADSITLDPHKSGFIPYPAGGLCYRNGDMRKLIAFAAPVVVHGEDDPGVGTFGIEGSKPGAAAAGVYLSHSLIPADRSGYGRLLGRCIFNNKRFYAALVSMAEPEDPFTVTLFQRLPVEKAGGTDQEIRDQIDYIRNQIVPLENDALARKLFEDDPDPELLDLFRQIGSDLSIVNYAFNFKTAAGLNRDLHLMNEMNDTIFRMLSVHTYTGDHVPENDMFVTSSSFDPKICRQVFVDHFCGRAGVDPIAGEPATFLISTTQNPWLTATADGNFIPTLIDVLRKTASQAAQSVIKRHGLKPAGRK